MSDREKWAEELQSAHLYRVLAQVDAAPSRRSLFAKLAIEAEKQAEIWAEGARKAGGTLPERWIPDLRTRVVVRLLRWLGPRPLRPVLAAMKVRGLSVYTQPPPPGHALPASVEEVGRRHAGVGSGGNLRAAVFGANDGLVSNASLILGVAGASGEPGVILLSGVAGLLAGAFSMAAGEYVSVRSQRELFEYQIELERDELERYPEAEAAELALIYEARGLPKPDAVRLAQALLADPPRALDTLAREELGLDPHQLGSPWGAAAFSFLSFGAGASLPLLPFLLGGGRLALPIAIGVTAAALFGVGATISLFTGRSAARGGLRMLAIGGSAGAATYAIGSLLGVGLS